MARLYTLDESRDDSSGDLSRSFQSGHINFLVGSGASHPAIPLAGNVEQEIDALYQSGQSKEATRRLCELLKAVQQPSTRLAQGKPTEGEASTLVAYQDFLRLIEMILAKRRSTVLSKQATVFTTNYDLYFDIAARACKGLALATGFGAASWPEEVVEYTSARFSQTIYDTGNLYEYRVELPTLNLIKLHGCLSWQRQDNRIVRRSVLCGCPAENANDDEIAAFVDQYAVVLPQSTKFKQTTLDRTYYELLRIYANALERSNALLISFGFSFGDEHLLHITRGALKNPTLRLIAFAHDEAARELYATMFAANNNVMVVSAPKDEGIGFTRFNDTIARSVNGHVLK